MTPIIENMMNKNVENTKKAYALLDIVLGITHTTFSDFDIRMNEQDERFFVYIREDVVIVIGAITDKPHKVVVNVVNKENRLFALCEIDVNGGFEEKYDRFDDVELKATLSNYFTQLSMIPVVPQSIDEPDQNVEDVDATENTENVEDADDTSDDVVGDDE